MSVCIFLFYNDTKRDNVVNTHQILGLYLHILVLQEYWVLTESRIRLKPVLGSVRIVALTINSHEQTQ